MKVAKDRAKLKQLIVAEENKRNTARDTETSKPKIRRVSSVLQDQNNLKKYFEPKWVSIGPIHHGNPKLRLAEDPFKLEFAAKFIKTSGYESDQDLYKKIEEKIEELKKCFDEEVIKNYSGESLGWMLFLDGCFMLQFIKSYVVGGELKSNFNIKKYQIVFAVHDFLLLENQIPFLVLKLLMENSKNKNFGDELKKSVKEFIRRNLMSPGYKYNRTTTSKLMKILDNSQEPPAHLLDLLRSALLLDQQSPKDEYNKLEEEESFSIFNYCNHDLLRRFTNKFRRENSLPTKSDDRFEPNDNQSQAMPKSHDPFPRGIVLMSHETLVHVPGPEPNPPCMPFHPETPAVPPNHINQMPEFPGSSIQTRWLAPNQHSKQLFQGEFPTNHVNQTGPQHKTQGTDNQQFFRTVQDLKAAGIYLKSSKSCFLRDIKFSSLAFIAKLELPPLIVDDSTAPKFLNLIAYEMCPDNTKTEYEVTSYIWFLDSLIDYANDVKELRSAHIVRNFLGSDEEVARLFNEIGRDLVPNSQVYKKVIGQIEKHYENKCMTWMAQVIDDHFSSPWTIVTFVAALLALGLSATQTWFTVFSPPGPCDNFCQNLE